MRGTDTADTPGTAVTTGTTGMDALDVPAAAGYEVLDRFPAPRTGPVALEGPRMRFYVAAGGAAELPGLLDWLEWTGVPLDLVPLQEDEAGEAPARPGAAAAPRNDGAPVWLRPPARGGHSHTGAPHLPAMTVAGCPADGGPVGLVALVSALANACHRVRLRTGRTGQPCSFSYASRICAGTRPRSLTS
ncbi:SCO3374 family protein [Streptomyces sp. NPDC088733]|uniref:SCO3374 family protein n=1 Tax=Streptomyces sp. NPDC088733 TaxID=3365880 RepID=UPI0038205068